MQFEVSVYLTNNPFTSRTVGFRIAVLGFVYKTTERTKLISTEYAFYIVVRLLTNDVVSVCFHVRQSDAALFTGKSHIFITIFFFFPLFHDKLGVK